MVYLVRCVLNLKKEIFFYKNDEIMIINLFFLIFTILYNSEYKKM